MFRWTLMILHLLRMRRNVNRNVFNARKNVSATAQTRHRLFTIDIVLRNFLRCSHTWRPCVWKVDQKDTKSILHDSIASSPTWRQLHAECDLASFDHCSFFYIWENPARPVHGGISQLVLLSENTRHRKGTRSAPDESGYITCVRCRGTGEEVVHPASSCGPPQAVHTVQNAECQRQSPFCCKEQMPKHDFRWAWAHCWYWPSHNRYNWIVRHHRYIRCRFRNDRIRHV